MMVYVKLIWFCLKQLSLLGLWQSGAEMSGSAALKQRWARHHHLKNRASRLLMAMAADDLRRVFGALSGHAHARPRRTPPAH